MARSGVSSEQAFDILRRASQRTNTELRDLAADIVARAGCRAGGPTAVSSGAHRADESA